MGVEKTILEEGSGPQPQPGQLVVMGYTGWLKDTSKPDNKGKKYVVELNTCSDASMNTNEYSIGSTPLTTETLRLSRQRLASAASLRVRFWPEVRYAFACINSTI